MKIAILIISLLISLQTYASTVDEDLKLLETTAKQLEFIINIHNARMNIEKYSPLLKIVGY